MPENYTLNGHIPTQTISHSDEWSYATKENLDTLPKVWTRGLLYLIVVFIGIALPWGMLSKVDETGIARGRLEPQGKTFRLDAPVTGTVKAIPVQEGDTVKAGQNLVELESELLNTELQQQQRKLEGQQNRLNQLELLENQLMLALRTQQQQNQAQQLEKQAQIEQARQNLDSLKASYSLQKEEKTAQVEQAKQAIESSKSDYELAKIRLATAQEKIPRYKQAYEQGALSKERFLDVEQLAKENQKNLNKAKSEIAQVQSRLKEQQKSYKKIIHQASSEIKQAQLRLQEQERSYKSLVHSGKLALLKSQEQLNNLQTQITTLKAEIDQSKTQMKSLKFQLNQRVLKAPIDGIIFQLPVKGKGTVVQPGNMIAEIAPKGTSLRLKAQMGTTESGSLEKGMAVKIKFDAYPFQDYGVIEGKLMEISPTTKFTETEQGKVATYDLDIQLNQACIPAPNKCISLRPGDTATAEVIIRQRRLIDFILDPFKKLQQGGWEF
ncbi:MAG: HlyD family efflux transporter periplasmic adaptor subunit [Nostocaceae cyanobacterium]|nr:HlyD family efflux transporter periplasmic adaptor subunit [Nostocaceae cyanobacterium]